MAGLSHDRNWLYLEKMVRHLQGRVIITPCLNLIAPHKDSISATSCLYSGE